jgi:hypothetical protein
MMKSLADLALLAAKVAARAIDAMISFPYSYGLRTENSKSEAARGAGRRGFGHQSRAGRGSRFEGRLT